MFGEVTWFYPNSGSGTVNRVVCYNYLDSTPERPVWTTGTLARTAWQDSAVFGKPHATEYSPSAAGATTNKDYVYGNSEGMSTYFEHETGLDQVKEGSTTAISSNIESGDFDIGSNGLDGDGEFIMKIRRVLPDFLSQTGNSLVTLNLRDYPNDSNVSSSLGPFTVSSSTQKIVARIVQSLTLPAKDYDQQTQLSFNRDIDSIVQKLNTTFQQDLKEEAEAEAYYFG